MKISKLAIASLLTMGLVLTGCNSKKANPSSASTSDSSSGSQVDPVTNINVKSLSRALLVGETLNLDDYVTVVGGGDSKAYTAAIQSGQAAVSLEGKTLKAVAEGEFKLKLSAGERTATFSGEVLTKEAAAFQSYLNALPSEYGVQLQTYDEGGNVVDSVGKKIIHREDYLGHPYWTDDNPSKPGGWFIAADDNFYEWTADDMAGTNFKAIPGAQGSRGSWGGYYINMPIALSFSNFERVYDETSGDLIGFSMDDSVPGDSKFPTAIDLLMYCAAGYDFRSDYDKVLYVWFEEDAEGEFSYEFELVYTTDDNDPATPEDTSDDSTYGFPFRFLTETADITITPVEEYIASGEHPEPISFAEVTTKSTEIFNSKDYAYISAYGWFSSSFQMYSPAAVAAGLGLDAEYLNNYYPYGTEQGVVTAKGTYGSYTERVFEDVEGGGVNQVGTTTLVSGLYEKDEKVYQYSKQDGETDFTVQDTGAASLWTQLKNYVGAALVPSANFEVSSRTENEDGSITFKIASGSNTAAEIATAVNYFGPYNFASRISSSAKYIYAQVVIGADYAIFCWGINYGAIYGQVLQIANIGESNVLPVTDADLFPEP